MMDCTIQRLHSRYLPVARREAVPRMTERLDRIGRNQLSELLGQSLDRALADDPAVYVLRDLDVTLALHVSSVSSDTEVARRWAAKLTGAILRQVARGDDQERVLRRFADAVDFRVSFILDLLEDRAWDSWFYGAFEKYRELGTAWAIQAVLLEDRDELPAMLAELMRRKALDRTLDVLGAELMVEIWQQGLAGLPVDDAAVVRPLFAAALDLVDRLDLWSSSRPEAQELFEDYLASGQPDAGGQPTAVDWQDPQSLARGVFQAWLFLVERGLLRAPDAASSSLNAARLDRALTDLDWLDRAWLAEELRRWRKAGLATAAATETTAPSATTASDAVAAAGAGAESFKNATSQPSVLSESDSKKSLPVGAGERRAGDAQRASSSGPTEAGQTSRPRVRRLAEDPTEAESGVAAEEEVRPIAEGPGSEPRPRPTNMPESTAEFPAADSDAGVLPQTAASEPRSKGWRTRLQGGEEVATDSAEQEAAAALPASPPRGPVSATGSPLGTDTDVVGSSPAGDTATKAGGTRASREPSAEPAWREARVSDEPPAPAADAGLQGASAKSSRELPEAGQMATAGKRVATSVSGDESASAGTSTADAALTGEPRLEPSAAENSSSARGRRQSLPGRLPVAGPTPRQRRLLIDLRSSLVRSLGSLERPHPRAASNALRLYGGLIADSPRWSGESLVKPMIEGLLEAWAHLQSSSSPSIALQLLGDGRIEDALQRIPQSKRSAARESLRSLASLGEPGREIVAQLLSGVSRATSRSSRRRSAGSTEPASTAPRTRQLPEMRSSCAGLFLLARAVDEVRLASLLAECRLPLADLGPQLGTLLLTLGLRWGGRVAADDGQIDPALGVLAGFWEPPSLGELQSAWSEVETPDCARFQAALLRLLAGQRVIRGKRLELFFVADEMAVTAVIAGLDGVAMWPLGCVLRSDGDLAKTLSVWLTSCEDAFGHLPGTGTCDAWLKPRLGTAENRCNLAAVPPSSTTEGLGEALEAHRRSRDLLVSSLDGLRQGTLGLPQVDLTVGLAALVMLRVWARWLKQFSSSSAGYLLQNFLRRPGLVRVSDEELLIELEPGPMDFVLEMAGYMAPLERVSWLQQRTLRFSVGSQQ